MNSHSRINYNFPFQGILCAISVLKRNSSLYQQYNPEEISTSFPRKEGRKKENPKRLELTKHTSRNMLSLTCNKTRTNKKKKESYLSCHDACFLQLWPHGMK
jgi:hypothetical protein